MTRETQNILMGAVACAVAAVAMIAVSLILLTGDEDPTVAGIDPLSGQAVEAGDADAVGADGGTGAGAVPLANPDAEATPRSTLAVALNGDMAATSSTAPATSSTAAPTTAATTLTTAAPTTATTAAPTTVETTATTAAPDTSAGSSTEPQDGTSTSTEMTTSTPSSTEQSTPSSAQETSTTAAPAPSATAMNGVEREIARLTNELRANPNGPLKRQGPVINCDGRIRVDNSGGYEPIGSLIVHEDASLKVARPWSAQMSRSNFNHQPSAGVGALQNIGISVRSAGENIAYHNYSDKALNHFTGWRESDGHFCNMMDPGFTHIGVGEVTKADGISYATQNFFSLR